MTAIHHRSQRIHGASPRELAESWGLPSNEDGMAASMPARLEPVLQYRAKMGREYQRRMLLSRELQATAGELRNIGQDVAETCRKVEQTVARLREQRRVPQNPDVLPAGRLAQLVAHDLRSPLVELAQLIDWLRTDDPTALKPQAKSALRMAAGLLADLEGETQRLSDFAGQCIQGDQVGLVDMNAVLAAAKEAVSDEIVAHQAKVSIRRLPSVWGQAKKLETVFQQLLSNACRFQTPGVRPRIHVAGMHLRETVRIIVSDNGIGVPAKDQERIFRMYAHASNVGTSRGPGMGLAIARRVVERHGGRMSVESIPETTPGASFYVDLPATYRPWTY